PRFDAPSKSPAQLVASAGRWLVGREIAVEQQRDDRHDAVAHDALVDKAPGVTERPVSGLDPDLRDVEAVLDGERLDQVVAELGVDRKLPIGAVAVVAPVGRATETCSIGGGKFS